MIGQRLGDRYEIQECLGKKSGRQTFLAWDQQAEQQVVIKLLSFNRDFVWDDLKLFEREAETLRTLSHPAIPRYLDFFEIDSPQINQFALVQSYVKARSLADHLRAGRTFAESDLKQLAASLLEILIYLQSRQPAVVHRDIKPSNVLLANRSGNQVGEVYLVDFGSVQTLVATAGETITVVGTYGYMAPEQFGGRTNPATDLYGLGTTLIHLATGCHPADIPQRRLKLQFEPLTQVEESFKQWLAQLVEPDLDERFVSASAALQSLKSSAMADSEPSKWAVVKVAAEAIAQPEHSQIRRSASDHHLTFQFPQKALKDSPSAPSRLWNAAPVAVGLGLLVMLVSPPVAVLVALVWIGGSGIEIGIRWLIRRLRNRSKSPTLSNILKITQNQLFLRLYEGDRLTTSLSLPLPSITKLTYQDSHERFPSLIIEADQRYEFGSDGVVSPKELRWMAEELSQRLNLPIRHTRDHLVLPSAVAQQEETLMDFPNPVAKPSDSKVILLKRISWIDILIPATSNQEVEEYDRLHIDEHQIRQSFAHKQDPLPGLRMSISAIEYCSVPDRATGFLRVWAGKRKYEFGKESLLSTAELEWLTYELSEWLSLPVYHLPNATPSQGTLATS
jgi:serine/threonine protein kinase